MYSMQNQFHTYRIPIVIHLGYSISTVARMALEDINKRSDILKEYKLRIEVTDSRVRGQLCSKLKGLYICMLALYGC